ncbi:MAG: NfeD family protein [Coriobacteriia bacterium]|jgi:membrane protein implicated in regulation of membrane protease activity|nr:NfeD family protein [Coriobacteriia bacterium]
MEMWFWVWLGLAAILIVGEIFTAGFFMLPFGLGAAVAAGLAFVKVPLPWQWVAFLVVSAVLLLSLRRFADRVTHEPPEKVGVDRLIGKQGVVIEDVEPGDGSGRVRIQREEWRADASGAQTISVGSRVTVERISGTHLIVSPADDTAEAKE